MKKTILTVLFFVFLISVSDVKAQSYSDFTLPDLDGNSISLSEFLSKGPVLISFWASWCSPCKEEMKQLNTLYEKYKDQGFTYLAVNVDNQKSISKVKPYISANGYNFPVVLDTDNAIFEAYLGQGSIPYSVLVSQELEVVATHTGFVPGDEKKFEAEIVPLLNSAGVLDASSNVDSD